MEATKIVTCMIIMAVMGGLVGYAYGYIFACKTRERLDKLQRPPTEGNKETT